MVMLVTSSCKDKVQDIIKLHVARNSPSVLVAKLAAESGRDRTRPRIGTLIMGIRSGHTQKVLVIRFDDSWKRQKAPVAANRKIHVRFGSGQVQASSTSKFERSNILQRSKISSSHGFNSDLFEMPRCHCRRSVPFEGVALHMLVMYVGLDGGEGPAVS